MGYVLIVGKNYKDCKAKRDSLGDGSYTFVTKLKHLGGIDYSDVILADGATENPDYDRIIKSIKLGVILDGNGGSTKSVDVPEVIVSEKTEVETYTEPDKSISTPMGNEEFKTLMDELITQEEESGEIMVTSEEIEEPIIESVEELITEEDSTEGVITEELVEEEPTEEIITEESVEEEVITEEVVEESVEELVIDIEPVNKPRGWHARNEFIDDDGNIFHKGDYVGNIND